MIRTCGWPSARYAEGTHLPEDDLKVQIKVLIKTGADALVGKVRPSVSATRYQPQRPARSPMRATTPSTRPGSPAPRAASWVRTWTSRNRSRIPRQGPRLRRPTQPRNPGDYASPAGTPDQSGTDKVTPAGGAGHRRPRGGLICNTEHFGVDQDRYLWDKSSRVITINLDHPVVVAARGLGDDEVAFRRLCHEIAFTAYAVASRTCNWSGTKRWTPRTRCSRYARRSSGCGGARKACTPPDQHGTPIPREMRGCSAVVMAP